MIRRQEDPDFDPAAPSLPAHLAYDHRRKVYLWRVWCDYCNRWHTHAAGRKGDNPMLELGFRCAHCYRPESPYMETGYNLIYGGHWKDLKVRR